MVKLYKRSRTHINRKSSTLPPLSAMMNVKIENCFNLKGVNYLCKLQKFIYLKHTLCLLPINQQLPKDEF